ncbi:hypothetical protein SAMN05192553_101114 [Cyclobacterium xiamenense]|uniref:Uncharacterized protein n=1 Tax=Cyclobacterium xiamenense TaxID=1297121 RepID=A0A1H6T5G6_9BACT|nr:hypothetical protein [Cyclobacterium xiamenense]SEI75333.1 hypothetical protein SAMN05192553_101114 [Cyclobacterium xiamenense]
MKHPYTLKASITLLVLLAVVNTAFPQTSQTEVEIIQEAFGLEKEAALANFMDLGADAENFWAIYDEYEAARKKLGNERIQVISEYAQHYPNITDEKIIELFKRTNAFRKSFAKLQQTYFRKMKKEVGVQKAAQFWQLETYFSSLIQVNIYSLLPFIGENTQGN